jgi:hypothetical protein
MWSAAKHRRFRSTEKTNGSPVAGVQDDALALGHILNRLDQISIETLLPFHLEFHRLR